MGEKGDKTITLIITGKDGSTVQKNISTSSGDLMTALEESGLGKDKKDDPDYIISINRYTADLDNYK